MISLSLACVVGLAWRRRSGAPAPARRPPSHGVMGPEIPQSVRFVTPVDSYFQIERVVLYCDLISGYDD